MIPQNQPHVLLGDVYGGDGLLVHMRTGHRVTAYQIKCKVADNNVDVRGGSGHGNQRRSNNGEHRAGYHLQFSMNNVVTTRQPFLRNAVLVLADCTAAVLCMKFTS